MRKLALFAALCGLLTLSSCSSDDPTVLEQEIVGTWELHNLYNFTPPAGTPKYIRFDGNSYYSSDTDVNPTSNSKSYKIEFKEDKDNPIDLADLEKGFNKAYFINLSGDREYRLTIVANDLDLSYVITSYVVANEADGTKAARAVTQSLPYKRVQ